MEGVVIVVPCRSGAKHFQSASHLPWTEAEFTSTLRTGVTPSGHQLSESMPWPGLGKMTDDEMQAVWLYLQSLPALPTTVQ